jgi:hypothetical protein
MLCAPFFQSRRPLPLKRVTFNNECEFLLDIFFRLTKNGWAFYRYLLTDWFALSDCFMDCVKAMPGILVWSVPYLPYKCDGADKIFL